MEPVLVEFISESACLKGRFFPAVGIDNPPTLLFGPGWPANPEDFLGLGPLLSQRGVNMMEFYPRGLHQSEGTYTHSGAMQDIASALQWIGQINIQKQFKVDATNVVLGGFSNGGGLALAYTAQDSRIRRVVSMAGNDFGEFARQLHHDPAFAENIHRWLLSTRSPDGPAHFDPEIGEQDVTFIVYHTDHSFSNVRERLAADIAE
ncbi:MAG: alpha/beta fold hydrolase [Anaerolineales bacterium]